MLLVSAAISSRTLIARQPKVAEASLVGESGWGCENFYGVYLRQNAIQTTKVSLVNAIHIRELKLHTSQQFFAQAAPLNRE
jgi:hypothetical protein